MREGLTDPRRVQARLSAVTAVRQVVQAIWALARAQLPLVEAAAAETVTYLGRVDDVITRLAGPPAKPPEEVPFTVIIGPERPYCGALARQILEQAPAAGELGIVGHRLAEAVGGFAELEGRVRFELGGVAILEEVPDVAESLARELLLHTAQTRIDLLHPTAGSAELRHVVVLSGARGPRPSPPESYTETRRILEVALGESLRGHLAAALVEALRAEVRARMSMAESARLACDRKVEDLERARRVLRQEEITNELSEIVAGRLAELRP
jgi:F-type H+-transporting ATPase subunit gamma